MTSSLVGSEMCIRDSLLQDASTTTKCPLLLEPLLARLLQHTSTTARVVAVSYTHLTLPTICSV
eukprot:5846435-Prorocentrum_lima.AAC.1